jgi:hypothetical protein
MYNKIAFLFLELKFCDNPPERNYKEVKNTWQVRPVVWPFSEKPENQ